MSTNKTEHYGLHSWVGEDVFLRTEFNENFAKLDDKIKAEAQAAAAGRTTLAEQIKQKADAATVATLTQQLGTKAEAAQLAAAKSALEQRLQDLDGRKVEIIIGTYQGTDESNNRVEIGRKALAILIERGNGYRDSIATYGGLATPDNILDNTLSMDDTGFTIRAALSKLNSKFVRYVFVAFVE